MRKKTTNLFWSICFLKPFFSEPKYKPMINQIEINPFLYRPKTIKYFQDKGVVMQSYRSLRDGKEFGNEVLILIGEKYGRSVAQVRGGEVMMVCSFCLTRVFFLF